MSHDPSAFQRAIRELRYFAPLDEQDARYVERLDRLGQRLINRVIAPTASTVLLGGPSGCGKSTELLRLHHQLPSHLVVYCHCGQDLDLTRLDLGGLLRYLTWAVLDAVCELAAAHTIELGEDTVRDALATLYSYDTREWGMPWRAFADRAYETQQAGVDAWASQRERSLAERRDALTRLLMEVHRVHRPVLLLIDGLEKLAPATARELLGEVVRSGVLLACQSMISVPPAALYGWGSFHRLDEVDVFSVEIEHKPEFLREVLVRRAGGVMEDNAADLVASYSGGIVRDGLQLATLACRSALDARDPRVTLYHANSALRSLSRNVRDLLSDDPERAEKFLRHAHLTRALLGDAEMRDRLISAGGVLPRLNGGFRVHPVFELAFHLARGPEVPPERPGKREERDA